MPVRRHLTITVLLSAMVVGLVVLADVLLSTPSPRPAAAVPAAPPATSVVPSPAPIEASRAAEVLDAASRAGAAEQYRSSVLDLTTGDTGLGPGALVPMYSASLAKLVVAVDIMGRPSEVVVAPAEREQLRRALSISDDAAMSALWVRFDGYGAVARVAERYGLTDTTAPSDPGQWGSVEISARDVAVLYQVIVTELEPAESRFVLDALDSAPAQAADGFDQSFGLLAAGGSSTKQGWACCYSGARVMHSVGVLNDRYVLVLLSSTTSSSYSEQRLALTAAARAAAAVV